MLGVGSGRSGTTSLAAYLDGMVSQDGTSVTSRHESAAYPIMHSMFQHRSDLIREIVESFSHQVEVAPYFWLMPSTLDLAEKVAFIVRHGRKVVTYGMVRGWYGRDSIWDEIKPQYPGGLFEKCCQFWAKSCEVIQPIADVTIRLEDLLNSEESRMALLNSLNIRPSDKECPKTNPRRKPVESFVWTDEHHEIFNKHCGRYMDTYYPGWQQ